MPTLTSKRFTHPETLRQIRPEALRVWLATARPFFEDKGLQIGPAVPASHSPEPAPLDYDHLARLLLQPTPDMPPDLIDSLYLIHEMATPAGMDAILEAAPAHGLSLDLSPRPTPADIALQAWLADRRLLETLHHRQELRRPRSFQYFSTAVAPVPPFQPPAPAQLAALETRLDAFYQAWQRGRGARVFAYWEADQCWFLVHHGLPWRREDTLDDGQPGAVHFCPQAHDILVYDPARGEMRVNCCSRREREALLASFGLELFGRKDFFPGVAKYTLAPLVRQGRDCLACLDVRGLHSVSLKEVEFFYPQAPWQRVTRKSSDIFALVERGALRWPEDVRQITRATFEIRFRDAPRTRRLTIIPSNKALYTRDDDAPLLEHWLAARHFIL